MLVSNKLSSRSLWALGLGALLAFGAVGCGSGDLPTASDVSLGSPSVGSSAPAAATSRTNPFKLNRPNQINRSVRALVPGKMQQFPAFELFRFNPKDLVRAMSITTGLRAWIDVNNDSSGYAWPSANGVGHVIVDGTHWFVDQPDVYASSAYVEIPLTPNVQHTVVLSEDFWATHDLEYNTFGNVTVSSGQVVEQGAGFNDKDCHPSCP